MYIHQVVDVEGKLLSYETLHQRIPQKAGFFIEYNVLLNALRGVYVDMNIGDYVRTIEGKQWKQLQVKNYKILLNKKHFEEPRAQEFWNNQFPERQMYWSNIWECCSLLKLDGKIQDLQWKILHNVYPTKVLLKKMGKSDVDILY